ncbi:MAG: hypothetical protein IJ433_00450 [Ruminococcus sp.]|nr:hypothetical protein [Ruminococcus sp.]
MKRTLSVFLMILLVLSTLTLTACGTDKAVVESVLQIDSNYSGHRCITVKYPLSVYIDELEEELAKNNPLADSEKSTFEYVGVDDDGYRFVMDIVFSSHDEYISQVSTLIGRTATSYLAQPSSVLAKGTRMKEDFDTADLISWMAKCSSTVDDTKNVEYNYKVNTVNVNGEVFNTKSTVDIQSLKGHAINSIMIETTNLKDGTYDRTITFSVPNKTYIDLSGSIKEFFTTNTSPAAQYCDWTSRGTSWEYTVIYKGITLEELSEYTAMLLDTDTDEVFYGDKDNSSTPLSEGLVFEESFNTSSFIGNDGGVKLSYKYALPTKTTHGDGSVYADGKWSAVGTWQDGVYSVDSESDSMNIRIPDGIQYAINGIRMDMEVLGKDNFVRTAEFLYSKTQGMDGMHYAQDFFLSKGAETEIDEDEDNLICRVIFKGDSATITDHLVKCFGSGNFVAYDVEDKALSLSDKTKLSDYIDLSYMLNSTNANRPITYTVHSSSAENIIDMSCDSVDATRVSDNSDVFKVDVKGGQGTVSYNGNIPDKASIIVYCVIGLLMLLGTVSVIVLMLKKQQKKITAKQDVAPSVSQQTTTFSIAELKTRKEKIDKQYRDEIDKDIEKKIEADRIEGLSRELKAKELEKLTRMVNGEPVLEEQPEKTETEDEDV